MEPRRWLAFALRLLRGRDRGVPLPTDVAPPETTDEGGPESAVG